MADTKDVGGVALAFVGFVLLVGALKGTWRDAYAVLTGGHVSTSASTGAPPKAKTSSNSKAGVPGQAPAGMRAQ